MEIIYKIKMLSDWHVGSGLDSATNTDVLVLKDDNQLPYIPGKTMKGLLRDACIDINEVQKDKIPKDWIDKTFGYVLHKDNDEKKKVIKTVPGTAFFSNAYLPKTEALEIGEHSDFLYKNISSTSIGRRWKEDETTGVAKEKSLRTIQVTIPLELEGTISNLDDNDNFTFAFKWLRHLGVNRNKGLGRCKISTLKTTKSC